MADGSRSNLRYIAETVWGTTPTSPVFKTIRHKSCSLALDRDLVVSEELRPDRNIQDLTGGNPKVSGDVACELSYGSLDDLLAAGLSGTWATGVPIVGTDQLKNGTTRTSFTLERLFGDIAANQYHRHTGCEVSGISLTVSPSAIVQATFSFMGIDTTTGSAILSGATYTAQSTTQPMTSFTGAVREGGSTVAFISEISLNISPSMNPKYVIGNGTKGGQLRSGQGKFTVTGSLTAFFEDMTLYTKYLNSTSTSIEFDIFGTGTQKYTFKMPKAYYTAGSPDVGGDGPIVLKLPFQAVNDATSSSTLIIERTP